MTNPKGTQGATAFVRYLAKNGFPNAERRVQHGNLDEGDITGTPCLTFEVKNRKTYSFRQWLRESAVEKVNAKADYCPLIVKPVGIGLTSVEQWWFILPVDEGIKLLREAGYGDRS